MMNWLRQTFEISFRQHPTVFALEGLRGVAVFLVFLVHFCGQLLPWLPAESGVYRIAAQLSNVGNAGVDLFFVLSGYLIYGSLIKKPVNFGSYLRRRVERIYPTFLFVLAIYLVLSWAFPSENKFPAGLSNKFLFLLQNVLLLPGIFDVPPIITVAWSLSYEFFYYLLIPSLVSVFFLRSWNWRSRAAFFLAASIIGFVYFYFYTGHVRLLMFAAGILLFETVHNSDFKLPRYAGLPAFALALFALGLFHAHGIGQTLSYATLFVLFFAVCHEAIKRADGTARILSWAPLRWFGNISFSYYLMHGLTLKAAFFGLAHAIPPAGNRPEMFWLLPLPFFAATLVTSALLFIWIEKPFSLQQPAPAAAKTEAVNGASLTLQKQI